MTPADVDRVFGRGRVKMVTGEHVEVYREAALPGERRRYTKRFLATDQGDFRHWTVCPLGPEGRLVAVMAGYVPRRRPIPSAPPALCSLEGCDIVFLTGEAHVSASRVAELERPAERLQIAPREQGWASETRPPGAAKGRRSLRNPRKVASRHR